MLAAVPEEVLFTIVEHLQSSQLLTLRLVNQTLNNIATEVFNRIHSTVKFRTTTCVNSFVNLMANRTLPIYTKFEFNFEEMRSKCMQHFATEIGPQIREYSFKKSNSPTQILTLLQNSPYLEVVALRGNDLRKFEILSCSSNYHFPNYLYLRVIICNDMKDDCSEVVKIIVSKAPNLKRIYLSFCGKKSSHSLQIIQLLPPATKINLFLIPENNEGIIPLSKTMPNIDNIYIYTAYNAQERNMTQPVSQLLNSQSKALKILGIHSFSEYAIPPLHKLESLRLIPQRNWDVVALSPGDFPKLSNLELYNQSTFPMFSTCTWANVTTLQLDSYMHRSTNLLSQQLATVFPNLQKLVLRSTYSVENDLKCCCRHFTQIQELSLEFLDFDVIPNLWESITGGASYVEDLHTLLNVRDIGPFPKDVTMENLKLKKLSLTSCRLHTLNAILYVSFSGNFKLELLDLACHADCNLQAKKGRILEVLLKYHKSVIIR